MTMEYATKSRDRATDQVIGTVNYIRNPPLPTEPGLEHHTEDEPRTTMIVEPGRAVTITDARPARDSFTLDNQGFQLVDHASAIADMSPIEEDAAMAALYRTEIRELMLQVTGADEIIVRPGIKKRLGESAVAQLAALKNAKPARYVHADNSDSASDAAQKGVLAARPDLDPTAFSRFAIYNIWRSISAPPQDIPLALCDARSVAPGDPVVVTAITIDSTYGDIRHETLGFRYNPDHRWYYFSDMTSREVLIFKQHDSDPARPRRVPHSAFDDPSCPPVAHTRCSVEIRVVALFR
ncbi:MAG: CmcJ/NvfI family oxidoreductase [Sphingobium sp.]